MYKKDSLADVYEFCVDSVVAVEEVQLLVNFTYSGCDYLKLSTSMHIPLHRLCLGRMAWLSILLNLDQVETLTQNTSLGLNTQDNIYFITKLGTLYNRSIQFLSQMLQFVYHYALEKA